MLADPLGNRIPDFSVVGYRGGAQEPPEAPVRVTVVPGPGDDTARRQSAIDHVQRRPLCADGSLGAVYLAAGEFQISNQITITASGVVLRGAGQGTNDTVLRATGPGQRTLIVVTGSGSPQTIPESTRLLTDTYVPVGARSLELEHTRGLSVGDRVLIRRIATDTWIHDLGMDLLCCPPDVNPWTPAGYHMDLDRGIVAIEGRSVVLDAPLPCAIEQRYAGGTLRLYSWPGRIQHVGIEDLEGISDFAGPEDEDHAWTFIHLQAVEHAWVRRVTARHFGFAAVSLGRGARHVTVSHCTSLDPVSQVTGGRRYAFVMDDCELCLVRDCVTRSDRHQFVTQSLTAGPNVFVDGRSENALSDAGPHHRWATGALWDNVQVEGHDLNVQNRGNLGSGHGWAGANCVVWNCRARNFVVQNPPGARNWLIGSVGNLRTGTVYVGPHDPGTYDRHGSNVFPQSLYYAQLQNRLSAPNVQVREYWLGQRDAFGGPDNAIEIVEVDPAWRTSVRARAGAEPRNTFNTVGLSQWLAFTFHFALDRGRVVHAAALQLCLKPATSNRPPPQLYLDQLERAVPGPSLIPGPVETNGARVYLVDLDGALDTLRDGQLNLALQGDWGVDWALLELHLSAAAGAVTLRILPEQDAHVRDGTFATFHFGAEPLLAVQLDRTPGYPRLAYLRRRLPELQAPPAPRPPHAALQLTPLTVGTAVEHALAPVPEETWPAAGLTWQTRPTAASRIATWLPQPRQTVLLGLTPWVQGAWSRSRSLAFQIAALQDAGPTGYADYAASEYPEPLLRPQLLLTVPPELVPRPAFQQILLQSDRLRLRGEGHIPRALYRVRYSPELHTSFSQWTPILTNAFPQAAAFELDVPMDPGRAGGFYLIELL